MPPRRCLPSPIPMRLSSVGGLKGGSLSWCGRAAPARVLSGPRRLPRQGSCWGNLLRLSTLLWSRPWRCSGCLGPRFLSGFPPLPCYVWPRRAALTARAQVKGSKGEPLPLHTDTVVSDKPWSVIVGGGGVNLYFYCLGTATNVFSMEDIGN